MEKGTRGEKPANRNPSPPNRKEAKRRTKPRLRQNRRLILIPRHSIRSQNRGPKIVPSNPEIVTLCSEFLNGGTDTTATAVEWAVARMIENPEIQSRLYDEIRTTVGEKKSTRRTSKNAVPKRRRKGAFANGACQIRGYDIPTDTNVEFFLPGISEDPNMGRPGKVRSGSILRGSGGGGYDGRYRVKMIPFGIGRRICPGLSMATVHVNLMLARMVQEFEWSGHPDNGKVDLSEKLEFTVVMKNSLRAKITPRA
ncbi:hypothetical protein DH2020_021497 [Rehmannia glutinosa]|uniref:Cytochrome P450 protein n=1 Tax=Rehmannia glutinosa TaxID=99300 RepID=A0ABR0WAM1_REHGL